MAEGYTREQVAVLKELVSQAEGFFDFDAWGADLDEYQDDEEQFRQDMRAFLEHDEFGAWEGNAELVMFKKTQTAAGLSNRDVLIGIYGPSAFGHSWCSDPLHPNCDSRREELATRYSSQERELVTLLGWKN